MAPEKGPANYDLTSQLAEAIRLLAERVTPPPLGQRAVEAVNAYRRIAHNLRTVFGAPDDQFPKHHHTEKSY
jgi:hypothetical protein